MSNNPFARAPVKNPFEKPFINLTDDEEDEEFDFAKELEQTKKEIAKLLESSESSDVVEITKEEFENDSKMN